MMFLDTYQLILDKDLNIEALHKHLEKLTTLILINSQEELAQTSDSLTLAVDNHLTCSVIIHL